MSGSQKRFQKNIKRGHSAAWDQEWKQAAHYYRIALEEFPDDPTALTSLGLALFNLEKYYEALQTYKLAAHSAPNDPIPFEKIATILELNGSISEAVQAFMHAAELNMKSENVDKAIENWIKVINLHPIYKDAHTRLAMVYERHGKKNEAVTQYLSIASLLQQIGESDEAMKLVEQAIKTMPDNRDAQQAKKLLQSNRPLPSVEQPKTPLRPIQKTISHQLEDSQDTAIKPMDPISEAHSRALSDLAELIFEPSEDIDTSRQINHDEISELAQVTGERPTQPVDSNKILLHVRQVIDFHTKGNEKLAAKELEQALEMGLNHPAANFILGLQKFEEDRNKALRYLQRAVKHPKYSLGSYLLMGKIYETEGNYQLATSAYLRSLHLADTEIASPDQADELWLTYEPVIEEQTTLTDETALKNLCNNISSQLTRPDWRQYLQNARQQLPEQPDGGPPISLVELLLELKTSQVVESLAYIRKLTNEGKIQSAMNEAFRLLQQTPSYLPLHAQIGELLLKEGLIQDAVNKFMLVAQLYNLRGEASHAIQLLMLTIKAAPIDITVRNQLIELLTAQGRITEAVEQYMNIADIHYHLAELDKARKAYSSAFKLAQRHKADHSLRIKILYKMADVDMQRLDLRNTVGVLIQIRRLDPEDAQAWKKLVEIYFRLGEKKSAFKEIDEFTGMLEKSGDLKTAINFLGNITKEWSDNLELHKRLSVLYAQNSQVVQAVEELDFIAESLLDAGNKAGVIATLEEIIALKPPNLVDYKSALTQLQK